MFCNNPASYGIHFHRISELKHEELIRLQAQVDKENKFAQSSSVNTLFFFYKQQFISNKLETGQLFRKNKQLTGHFLKK